MACWEEVPWAVATCFQGGAQSAVLHIPAIPGGGGLKLPWGGWAAFQGTLRTRGSPAGCTPHKNTLVYRSVRAA